MTTPLPLFDAETLARLLPPDPDAGHGALCTERGALPLEGLDVGVVITGLSARTVVRQTFRNAYPEALEATYVFPLPDRAAVSRLRLRIGARVVEGALRERKVARQEYARAVADGRRAALAEEERPGVFTMSVGNILPGERVEVELELSGPLPVEDGEVTYRFPLVVAPRFIPGAPLPRDPVGSGTSPDTDLVPDASRITPPVLLPGRPDPVRFGLRLDLDPAGLEVSELATSLQGVEIEEGDGGARRLLLNPGTARLDRDFLVRFRVGGDRIRSSLVLHPDPVGAGATFALTVVPPRLSACSLRPRDVIVVLDRSGSMDGWKMPAARRATGRLIESLNPSDQFGLVLFDSVVEMPDLGTGGAVAAATDRRRFCAVETLGRVEARGSTMMVPAIEAALGLLGPAEESAAERVIVLITDGQVGNEDALLERVQDPAADVRVFTVGIDQAVNASLLQRLADVSGGLFSPVESEDRLDEVMTSTFRRIGRPVLTGLHLKGDDFEVQADSLVPARAPDVYPGVPAVLRGRFQARPPGTIEVHGTSDDGGTFVFSLEPESRPDPVVRTAWARARVLDLEHTYVRSRPRDPALAEEITSLSLAEGVLCRFTGFVATDLEEVVNPGGGRRTKTQPVETPSGWKHRPGTSPQHPDQGNAPRIALSNYIVDPAIAKLIPDHIAERHQMIPINKVGNRLTVAMADPTDLAAMEDIALMTGLEVKPVVADACEIDKALNEGYGANSRMEDLMEDCVGSVGAADHSPEAVVDQELRGDSSAIIRLVNLILTQAVTGGVNRITVEARERELIVWYRGSDRTRRSMSPPMRAHAAIIDRLRTMAHLKAPTHPRCQSGLIQIRVNDQNFILEVEFEPGITGERVTIRVFPESKDGVGGTANTRPPRRKPRNSRDEGRESPSEISFWT